ncbi:coiled-coil domain-containing protein [Coraliomargarita akajimensis]|nr:hypothetical protein [Coraliomargarita akajimensis]
MNKLITLSSAAIIGAISALPAQDMPSQEEMWKLIQAQQKQIEELRALVENNQEQVVTANTEAAAAKQEASTARAELQQTQAQLEATTLAVEESSSTGGWWERTSVGGYGELHANFYENADNQIDFHRFVLFINHEYNDWITLYTELELEHSLAGEGKPGEVELEQAFIRMDWTESFSTDAGLFILPIGITNETHEPNTFYGVERNNVEKYIIPTTWWEGGLKASYTFSSGLALDAAVTSGLDTSGDEGYIRGGRQKVASATLNEAAVTGRVKYTGIAGLELAGSMFYQNDLAQTDASVDYSGLLSTAHAIYNYKGFGFKALYARWDLSGDLTNPDAEEQQGYFLEPSYRFRFSDTYGELGLYFRYSNFEYFDGGLFENEIYEVGINYWPVENVVFKADIQDISSSDKLGSKGDYVWNLGVGYQF